MARGPARPAAAQARVQRSGYAPNWTIVSFGVTRTQRPAIMDAGGIESMPKEWTIVGHMLCWIMAGCTGTSDGSVQPLEDELELSAEPSAVAAPAVVSVALGLWFTPMALEVGDFDGDTEIDLLVVGVQPGMGVTAAVLRGDGTGSFDAPLDAGLSACSAFPVVGDLDGDGRTDVVTLGCSNDLAVFMGQPDGTLVQWSAWPAAEYTPVSSTVIADYEGDGDADLMTLRIPDAAFLDVALGNGGEGIWRIETTEIGHPDWSGFDPRGLAMGHFDDDGLLDAVLLEREHDVVQLLAVPPATFGFQRELGVDVPPWSVRVGDLDGDGRDDLVVSSHSLPSVQTVLADGTGEFSFAIPVELQGFAPYDTTLGDLDGDGVPDVAMVDDTVPEIHWLRGNGVGGLVNLHTFDLPSPAIRIHAAYVDGDDREDLIAATFADDSVTLVLSDD